MPDFDIIWDDEPGRNVDHVAEHGIAMGDVEDVLYGERLAIHDRSISSGQPMTYGYTSSGMHIVSDLDRGMRRPAIDLADHRLRSPAPRPPMTRTRGTPMPATSSGKRLEFTPEQLAEHDAIHERFKSRPTIDELIASGEVSEESIVHVGYMQLRFLAHALKAERNRLGWGQNEAGERSGMSGPVISNIETGKTVNPTLDTLYRYALAMGFTIRMTLEPMAGKGG